METIGTPERIRPPDHGDENTVLPAWLDYYRATLLVKCAGLTLEQLGRRAVAPSSLSLLGMLRHMTRVEQLWFDVRFAGHDVTRYYVDPNDLDAEFNDLDSAPLDDVVDGYRGACARSRELAAGHSLDERVKTIEHHADVDLRCIYIHMIEEYARHCGHADLLRECIDGATGD